MQFNGAIMSNLVAQRNLKQENANENFFFPSL